MRPMSRNGLSHKKVHQLIMLENNKVLAYAVPVRIMYMSAIYSDTKHFII